MPLRLGKRPFAPDPRGRDLQLKTYLRLAALPPLPPAFGHEALVPPGQWGMLGNDQAGDCVFAGAAHETMLWTLVGGHPATFSPGTALADYAAVTGYDPAVPASDQGTSVRAALKYRVHTGLLDVTGQRHKLGAFVALAPGNIAHLEAALYLFEAVGLGFRLPTSAITQFEQGEVWAPVAGATLAGGHYVPLVARRRQYVGVTWGQLQPWTPAFYEEYCDEAWGLLSPEMLVHGTTSAEGFDLATLQADLAAVQAD